MFKEILYNFAFDILGLLLRDRWYEGKEKISRNSIMAKRWGLEQPECQILRKDFMEKKNDARNLQYLSWCKEKEPCRGYIFFFGGGKTCYPKKLKMVLVVFLFEGLESAIWKLIRD